MQVAASPVFSRLAALQRLADARPAPAQRVEDEEELLQGKALQRVEDEDLLQGKGLQRAGEAAPRRNGTALPDASKAGMESLAGLSMDHVEGPRDLDKRTPVQAREVAIYDNPRRGAEADLVGAKAVQGTVDNRSVQQQQPIHSSEVYPSSRATVLQREQMDANAFQEALKAKVLEGRSDEFIKALNTKKFIPALFALKISLEREEIVRLVGLVSQFIGALDAALKYYSDNVQTVRDMQKEDKNANFGYSEYRGEDVFLKGGAGDSSWGSILGKTLPKTMQGKAQNYVNGLYLSNSMDGYDYRPEKGICFHIKK